MTMRAIENPECCGTSLAFDQLGTGTLRTPMNGSEVKSDSSVRRIASQLPDVPGGTRGGTPGTHHSGSESTSDESEPEPPMPSPRQHYELTSGCATNMPEATCTSNDGDRIHAHPKDVSHHDAPSQADKHRTHVSKSHRMQGLSSTDFSRNERHKESTTNHPKVHGVPRASSMYTFQPRDKQTGDTYVELPTSELSIISCAERKHLTAVGIEVYDELQDIAPRSNRPSPSQALVRAIGCCIALGLWIFSFSR